MKAPRRTPSDLDILCYRYRQTMLPTMRSWLGDDAKLREFIATFGGLSFKVPPFHEQDRAKAKAEALELLAALDYAASTGRAMEQAKAEESLEKMRERNGFTKNAWKRFLASVAEAEDEISGYREGCRKALGETV